MAHNAMMSTSSSVDKAKIRHINGDGVPVASLTGSGDTGMGDGDLLPQELELSIPHRLLNRRRCSQSFIDAKEHAYARLMAELSKDLELRDEECEKLSKLRGQMEEELDELTASLFEEANKSIQDAHVQRIRAEKCLEDANHQIEVLQGEVAALKYLVMTSTPSSPNKHLHPQLDNSTPKKTSKPFWKKHRRSTSHHDFTKDTKAEGEARADNGVSVKEIDSVCYKEFQQWREAPSITDADSPFLRRVFAEDIQPCLHFVNKALAERVLQCVQQNTLTIEPVLGDTSCPRKCSLSSAHRVCSYKIKLKEDEDEWFSVSQMCRNRIAAVCDFYTYIRYICQNLVKCSDKEMFQEVSKLRLRMATARLGC